MMMYRSHRKEILVEINKLLTSQHSNGFLRGTAGSIDAEIHANKLNVNYQRIKPPINKTIGKTFKRENVNVLRLLLSSRFQDGDPATYPQQNSTRMHDNARTKLKQIMHKDKKQQ